MTMKTQQEHIEALGNHCPFCNSDEIVGGSFDVDNGRVFQPIYCLECDKGWENEYTISNYSTDDTDDGTVANYIKRAEKGYS